MTKTLLLKYYAASASKRLFRKPIQREAFWRAYYTLGTAPWQYWSDGATKQEAIDRAKKRIRRFYNETDMEEVDICTG